MPVLRARLSNVWIVCIGISLAASVTTASADPSQLHAALAMYFLQVHNAIPLHNNGSVKSGDVLHMPDEGTFLPRDKCYNLPDARYAGLADEYIQTNSAIAEEVGGNIPIKKIGQLEALFGGKFTVSNSILLSPFSQEEPPAGYSVLTEPKPTSGCEVIHELFAFGARNFILVTRVFHGKQNAEATIDLDVTGKVSGDLDNKIQTIVGARPRIKAEISGSTVKIRYSKSDAEHSLAVQSAFVRPEELASIYYATRTDNGIRLKALVREALTGVQPSLLTQIRIRIEDALIALNLRKPSTGDLYASVFSGEKLIPREKADRAQDQWEALAFVAAAHELVEHQNRNNP